MNAASRAEARASKKRYSGEKVNMRTPSSLVAFFLFLTVASCVAQSPASGAASVSDRQAPAVIPAMPQTLDSFTGSGTVDKLVPGVVKLSLLDAIDRGRSRDHGPVERAPGLGRSTAHHPNHPT